MILSELELRKRLKWYQGRKVRLGALVPKNARGRTSKDILLGMYDELIEVAEAGLATMAKAEELSKALAGVRCQGGPISGKDFETCLCAPCRERASRKEQTDGDSKRR